MASLFAARAPQRTVIPAYGIGQLIATGVLPAIPQNKPGYDLAYQIPTGFSASSVADAASKLATVASTTGLNIVATEKSGSDLAALTKGLLSLVGGYFSGGSSLVGQGIGTLTAQDSVTPILGNYVAPKPRGNTMAFADGDTGFFGNLGIGDIFSGVGQVLQGPVGRDLLSLGTQAATGFINQSFASSPNPGMATMAAVPAVVGGAGRAVATVGRGFFNRFPNLATAIQALRNRGASKITRSSLYSAMRRFGPEMLVSGGILTAAAVSELAIAGPGRRRMNPGNVGALRRAHRRMKSFHKLCSHNDMLYKRSRKK